MKRMRETCAKGERNMLKGLEKRELGGNDRCLASQTRLLHLSYVLLRCEPYNSQDLNVNSRL